MKISQQEQGKYNQEKLKAYLVSLGCKREDIDAIIDDYTRKVERKAYALGVKHYKRINKQMRIISRDMMVSEGDAFYYKLIQNYPVELADEFINIWYSHLPYIG
jgi:hypothetical protein